jgi:undecaprenyl diphosphate synthase
MQKKPKHLAIVMDGNGRWAEQRGLPRVEGHRQGLQVVKRVMEWCIGQGIGVLSLFTFSHENWERPVEEVNFLMDLFLQSLKAELPDLIQNGVKLRFLGSKDRLDPKLLEQMNQAEQATFYQTRLNLNIAINYSGKWDILEALQRTMQAKDANLLDLKQLESTFESHLSTHGLPNPDLFIRTSGEQRISNFFLWQIAYTELYFTEIFWPDFSQEHFNDALNFFAGRERRFGKTSQQLKG